jgi:hypothetical protein
MTPYRLEISLVRGWFPYAKAADTTVRECEIRRETENDVLQSDDIPRVTRIISRYESH